MPTIAELLASRKGVETLPRIDEDIRLDDDVDDIPTSSHISFPKPDRNIFLAIYTPYILNPYKFNWYHLRDYSSFLLNSECYVLNTFQQLDVTRIFNMYVEKMKPYTLHDYTLLCYFCNHIKMCIPGFYQDEIELLIDSIKEKI